MNWKEIFEKYPKAVMKCYHKGIVSIIREKDTKEITDINLSIVNQSYNLRNLYDFFDENEIYCCVIPGFQLGTGKLVFQIFIMHYEDGYELDSRKLAEDFMFLKAFEILEQKLQL